MVHLPVGRVHRSVRALEMDHADPHRAASCRTQPYRTRPLVPDPVWPAMAAGPLPGGSGGVACSRMGWSSLQSRDLSPAIRRSPPACCSRPLRTLVRPTLATDVSYRASPTRASPTHVTPHHTELRWNMEVTACPVCLPESSPRSAASFLCPSVRGPWRGPMPMLLPRPRPRWARPTCWRAAGDLHHQAGTGGAMHARRTLPPAPPPHLERRA